MQVSGLQHPVVSARIQHARSETNSGFGPAPCAIGVRGADPLQSADEGGQEVGGCPRGATPQRVYRRYILALTCGYLVVHDTRPRVRGADGPHTGRTPGGMPEPFLVTAQ
jgi:hypothetical protein